MLRDDFLANGQSQTGALNLCGKQRVKYLPEVLITYAFTGVDEMDRHMAVYISG